MADRKYSTKQIQEKCLEIMDYIDDICRKNDIEYSLAYGTLIGAIRHKGFIPWDDDIDLMIVRSECDRLVEAIVQDNNKYFKVSSLSTDPEYHSMIIRVYDARTVATQANMQVSNIKGVWVDIFPIDYMYDSTFKKKVAYYKKVFYHAMAGAAARKYVADWEPNRFAKKALKGIAGIWGARYWTEKVDNMARSIPSTCHFMGQFASARVKIHRFLPKEIALCKKIDWDFEGRKYKIFEEYDRILRSSYGDYMQLPPEEKRVSIHHAQILSLGEDYVENEKEN